MPLEATPAPSPPTIDAAERTLRSIGDGYSPSEYQQLILFEPFTSTHLAALAACFFAAIAVILTARRVRPAAPLPPVDPYTVDPAGRVLGALALSHWVAHQAWWAIPARFIAGDSLPLHMCDLTGCIAAFALLTGWRPLAVITYFWALGLSTQAFVTPVVEWGPLITEFWLFWESHTLIVGAAAYLVLVRRFRPGFRDLLLGYGALVAYAAIMMPIDLLMGWNYGYIGNIQPTTATLIDHLGPWPWRLIPMAAMSAFIMTMLWLPWAIFRARTAPAPHPDASSLR